MAWSDFTQLLIGIVGLAVTVGGGAVWLVKRHVHGLHKQIARLESDLAQQRRERDQVRAERNDLRRQAEEARQAVTDAETRVRRGEASVARLSDSLERVTGNLNNVIKIAAQTKARFEQARNALDPLRQAAAAGENALARLREENDELGHRLEEHKNDLVALETRLATVAAELATRDGELRAANELAADLRRQLQEHIDERADEAPGQRRRVWERPIPEGTPRFEPLTTRKMPILSVVNLKGGVGKTTLAANLGAMLAEAGKRVLLVDLDYQRSLSLLCCTHQQLANLHRDGRCVQHFLVEGHGDPHRFLRCIDPVPFTGGCSVVATTDALTGAGVTDSLEDAEMHLLAGWIARPGGPDVRFLLRQALHAPAVRALFDVVLLDCPPRLSTACVNALAASDFAVVPVLPDATSAASVPNLLRKLRRLRDEGVLAHFRPLGVVANRVTARGGELIRNQRDLWSNMPKACAEAWGAPVHFFRTTVKQSARFAEAAEANDTGRFAAFTDELKPAFTDLVGEIQERIGHESQRPAAVPA